MVSMSAVCMIATNYKSILQIKCSTFLV